MQTQISKLGRSRPQSKGLHYFKSAEVCTCKHFQKSARSNDIKSLFFLHIKGLHFMRLYKSPFTRWPCGSSSISLTSKVSVYSPTSRVSNRSARLKVRLRSRAFEVLHNKQTTARFITKCAVVAITETVSLATYYTNIIGNTSRILGIIYNLFYKVWLKAS